MSIAADAIRLKNAVQKRSELEQLVDLLQTRDLHTIVEIGTQQGGSLWLWCQIAEPDAMIISIDLPGGPGWGGVDVDENKLLNMTRDQQTMYLIRDDSRKPMTLSTLLRYLDGRKIDMLFIDGDHSYWGVKSDYILYSPLVAPDGFIVFHDITKHYDERVEVDRFWKEMKRRHKSTFEFVENDGSLSAVGREEWGGIGVVRVRRGE